MKDYYWNTEEPHSNNTVTMGDFLENELDEGVKVIIQDGSYAEIETGGKLYEVHASGDGDFISIKGKMQEGGDIKYEDLDNQLAKYKGKMVKVTDDETGKEVEVDAFEYLKENIENNNFTRTS